MLMKTKASEKILATRNLGLINKCHHFKPLTLEAICYAATDNESNYQDGDGNIPISIMDKSRQKTRIQKTLQIFSTN